VILAPDGDMAAYLDSLSRLKGYGLQAIAPGHGRVLRDPVAVIDGVIAHRARREAKVVAVLSEVGRSGTDDLLPRVYDDVRPELLPIARASLEAHLIKLLKEGRATNQNGIWAARRAAVEDMGAVR
jgi:glyoxylase-like metal-dependent hydrolase (beta-lactamase superfamily II)